MISGPSTRGAIVVAGHPNGLDVVRSLGSRGIPVVVISTAEYNIAQYSRYCMEHVPLHNLYKSGESLIELLEDNKSRWGGWGIYPTNDHAIEALARHYDRLCDHYRLAMMPWEVASKLLNKDASAKLAAEAGVDQPVDYGPATAKTAQRGDIVFPVVVKPVQTHRFRIVFGCKLFQVYDRATLRERVRELGEAGLKGRIMELVPGGDETLYNYVVYMGSRGEPIAGLPLHKLRKRPPFSGVGRVVETGGFESLREPTIEMLRLIGYRGIASAEYKLDRRTGRLRFIETNGRVPLHGALSRRAGIDLPYLAWLDFVLDQKPTAQPNGWQGVWIHLLDDVKCMIRHRRDEKISFKEYLKPYLRPKVFAVWSRRDPKPFYMQWRMALGRNLHVGHSHPVKAAP